LLSLVARARRLERVYRPRRQTRQKDAAILVSYKVSDADWKLTISDNGGGKPDLSASDKKGGLGTNLVQALAKQLGAGVKTVSESHGTAVTITHATFKAQPLKAA